MRFFSSLNQKHFDYCHSPPSKMPIYICLMLSTHIHGVGVCTRMYTHTATYVPLRSINLDLSNSTASLSLLFLLTFPGESTSVVLKAKVILEGEIYLSLSVPGGRDHDGGGGRTVHPQEDTHNLTPKCFNLRLIGNS